MRTAGLNVRIWRPEAWRAIVLLGLGRAGEAMHLIDAGEKLAQAEGVPGKGRVWMMLQGTGPDRPGAAYPTPSPRPRRSLTCPMNSAPVTSAT